MSVKSEMEMRLQEAFQPSHLEVVDDSDSHIGHAGHDGAGESHFNVKIRAAAFAGMNRVQQHRAVHRALGDIVPRIHALALDIGS
ncbi:BolA family transcriptional regulator [Phaeobacter gallaeciensis]|uniref:BolA family transcriptional regulator n=1 Tax=Phaeobacter gallaeciensis TaxID=60890 RepID=A0A1B0ZW94_9RHOB|nr:MULTISPECIES: BolA family protein [Phaeobacter]MDF1770651.1 BolA family transcriptional regulator [Pseudophaeobacter sp. bin_em_oilr2.035]ANP38409.1 BolA family transcriptional regulator [Phaeobacter gallaeciensis]MDE4060252.1 BolA family transcriptional regulator [Phaeobacter gallaeciensis]MDE4123271.1 BolA family transcriptional regulator [Phaeobacter gallaeciensis]MDE4127612.1 BolA family transcriptional regulator [Phaeobacter gallaeciensis]